MMKQVFLFLLALVLFAVPAIADNNKAYDRVMESGTIRCGYYIWPPYITKDPNTGQLGGVIYDQMEYLAKLLSLKVDWVSEVNFDAMFEGFATGRYDMLCAPLVATPERSRASDFTISVLYGMYYMYAREGDTRFDNHYEAANAEGIVYATLDGDLNETIGKEDYPLAQKIGIGQNAANTDVLLMVSMGKADVTTLDPVGAMQYMDANPGKLRQVAGPPVRAFPLSYPVPIGEEKFKSMLNITLQSMLDRGYFNKMFEKNPDFSKTLLPIAPRYIAPKSK